MRTLRFVHTADWHLSEKPNLQQKAINSLNQLLSFLKENQIDGLLIAGDIWDRIQPFGNNSAIKLAYDYLGEFSKLVKFIYIIKGNSSHDAQQSVELLHQYKENIFAFEGNSASGIILDNPCRIINLFESDELPEIDLLIHGLSYPTKSQLIQGNSIDQQNDNFISIFEELMEFHGSIGKNFEQVPSITMFHGTVHGSKLSSGQTIIGQELIIPSFVLEKTASDYYALGHIHFPQNITGNMRYSGSLFNKDFGEIEQKYFDLLEVKGKHVKVSNIPFHQTRPMVILDAEFKDGAFIYDKNFPTNAEIKFRYTVSENERGLINQVLLNNLKAELGEDVKMEASILPIERSARSSKIMQANSLIDEVSEYAVIIGEELTSSLKEKISLIEQELMEEHTL